MTRCLRLAALALVLGSGPAVAQSLADALAAAYRDDPRLVAERARLRVADEGVDQALGGWRPTVTLAGAAETVQTAIEPNPTRAKALTSHPRDVDVTLDQPLYRGGQTVARTRQAEQLVEAERAAVEAIEAVVLLDAASAYFDLLRDLRIRDLDADDERILRNMLAVTAKRLEVADVTATDLAQAEARLRQATASLQQAEGQVAADRAAFERNVGRPPETVAWPDWHPPLPPDRAAAVAHARADNRTVAADRHSEDAARAALDVARGQLLPSLTLFADFTRAAGATRPGLSSNTGSVGLRFSMPLYEAGIVYSQVRAARDSITAAAATTEDARRQAAQGAAAAWDALQAAQQRTGTLRQAIDALTRARAGMQREAQAGTRTVIEVLNAEQELLANQIALASVEHDRAVAEFTLAAADGRLSARDLKLPVEPIDMTRHTQAVRGKWLGLGAP